MPSFFQYKSKLFEWILQAFFIENQRLLNQHSVQVRHRIELLEKPPSQKLYFRRKITTFVP